MMGKESKRKPLLLRRQIDASLMEWMAFENSFHRKKRTLEETPFTKDLQSIVAASGIKPASRRKQRRDEFLIKPNEPDSHMFHNFTRINSLFAAETQNLNGEKLPLLPDYLKC
jgi:hypothetical protein